jgi:Leucine Rich repeat
MEQQQQRTRGVHCSILNPILQLRKEQGGPTSHWLVIQPVYSDKSRHVDRRSIQYLVKFLQGKHVAVTELELESLVLYSPDESSLSSSGGGFWSFLRRSHQPPCCTKASSVEILHDFLVNDATLTTVSLSRCNFGGAQDAVRLLSAFYTNQTITDLILSEIQNLQGVALGNFLAELFHSCRPNSSTLLRFSCRQCSLSHAPAIRIFQPGLKANTTLKELCLSNCQIEDEGLASIADALVGNTSMDVLDLSYNRITCNGLDAVTRILECTQLHKLDVGHNDGDLLLLVNSNNDQEGGRSAVPRFAQVLSRNKYMLTLDMSTNVTCSVAATLIFQALESNATLQKLSIGRPMTVMTVRRHATTNDEDDNTEDTTGTQHQQEQCKVLVEQLVQSLPKMKSIRVLRLGADGWQQLLIHHAVVLVLSAAAPAAAAALHQNTSLEQLPGLEVHYRHDPELHRNVILATQRILVRNRCLQHVNALLQPQSQSTKHEGTTGAACTSSSSSSSLICSRHGIWSRALAHLGCQKADDSHSGASAIFQLFQNRPDLVEQGLHPQ